MNLDNMLGFIKTKYPDLKLWPLQRGELFCPSYSLFARRLSGGNPIGTVGTPKDYYTIAAENTILKLGKVVHVFRPPNCVPLFESDVVRTKYISFASHGDTEKEAFEGCCSHFDTILNELKGNQSLDQLTLFYYPNAWDMMDNSYRNNKVAFFTAGLVLEMEQDTMPDHITKSMLDRNIGKDGVLFYRGLHKFPVTSYREDAYTKAKPSLEQEYKRKREEFGPGPLERAMERRTLWGWLKSKVIPPKVKKDGWK